MAQGYLGNIRLAQGSLSEALAGYEAALEIQQHLAAQDPSNSEWQRDLLVSFMMIGDVQSAQATWRRR